MTLTLNVAAGLALFVVTTLTITRPVPEPRKLTTTEWWIGLAIAAAVALWRARWLLS